MHGCPCQCLPGPCLPSLHSRPCGSCRPSPWHFHPLHSKVGVSRRGRAVTLSLAIKPCSRYQGKRALAFVAPAGRPQRAKANLCPLLDCAFLPAMSSAPPFYFSLSFCWHVCLWALHWQRDLTFSANIGLFTRPRRYTHCVFSLQQLLVLPDSLSHLAVARQRRRKGILSRWQRWKRRDEKRRWPVFRHCLAFALIERLSTALLGKDTWPRVHPAEQAGKRRLWLSSGPARPRRQSEFKESDYWFISPLQIRRDVYSSNTWPPARNQSAWMLNLPMFKMWQLDVMSCHL